MSAQCSELLANDRNYERSGNKIILSDLFGKFIKEVGPKWS